MKYSFNKVAGLLRRYSGFHRTPPDRVVTWKGFFLLRQEKIKADERLDLPQVDLMNFRVEYVWPRSGRCLGREDDGLSRKSNKRSNNVTKAPR